MIADDAELEIQAGLLRVTDRGGDAAAGYRDHDVGGHAALTRQLGPDSFADLVDPLALDHTIGAGEVDVLEDAKAARLGCERAQALHAVLIDHHDLAGLEVAHELR